MSRFMASIYDWFMRDAEEACLRSWRAELLENVEGDVLELGAGTGANLAAYRPSVRRLVLVEPDPHMRTRLQKKAAARPRAEVFDAPAEALPFEDASFDAVVSTLVLCSVRDLAATLAEVRRVLRPGGRLAFLEHGASDDPKRQAWQRRIEPVWKHLAGNCHLTRRADVAIAAAGFEIESVRHESIRKSMPLARPSVRGYARNPGAAPFSG